MKTLWMLMAVAILAGCPAKEEGKPDETTPVEAPKDEAPASQPTAAVEAPVAIPEEYRAAAANEITAENADEMADQLAKEIAEDNE